MDYASAAPWVVLFDEFDALGRVRDDPSEHGEIKRVVNAFLQMLDSYHGPSLLIAATNHEGLLDRALWRRFDEVVQLGSPTVHQLRAVLRKRLGLMPHRGLDIDAAASKLKGLPHAAAEAAAWAALRRAVLAERPHLVPEDLAEAVGGGPAADLRDEADVVGREDDLLALDDKREDLLPGGLQLVRLLIPLQRQVTIGAPDAIDPAVIKPGRLQLMLDRAYCLGRKRLHIGQCRGRLRACA